MNVDEKLVKSKKCFKEWNEQYKKVFDSPKVQKEIDDLKYELDTFFQKIKIISEKYNVSNEYAACHICNYGDEYICKKFNGGCDCVGVCERIFNGENEIGRH